MDFYNIIAAGFIMGCAAIGASLGIALIGAKYLEGISRQPELTGFLRTQFFIILALVDAIPMIALGISLYLIFA